MADERLWIYTIADSGITSRGIMLAPSVSTSETSDEGAAPATFYRSVLVTRGTTEAMWYIDSEGSGTQNSRLVTMSPLSVAAPVLMTDQFPQIGDHYVPLQGSDLVANSILFIRWTSGTGGISGRGSLYIPTTYEELTGTYIGDVVPPLCEHENPVFAMLTATTGMLHQGTNIRIIEDLGTPPTVTDYDLFSDACTYPHLIADNGGGSGARVLVMYERPRNSGNYYAGIISISGITPSLVSETLLSFSVSTNEIHNLAYMEEDSVMVYGQGTVGVQFRRIDISGSTPVIGTATNMFTSSFLLSWDANNAQIHALVPINTQIVAFVYYIQDITDTNHKIGVSLFDITDGPIVNSEVIITTDVKANMRNTGIHMAISGSQLIVSWYDRPTDTKRLTTLDIDS